MGGVGGPQHLLTTLTPDPNSAYPSLPGSPAQFQQQQQQQYMQLQAQQQETEARAARVRVVLEPTSLVSTQLEAALAKAMETPGMDAFGAYIAAGSFAPQLAPADLGRRLSDEQVRLFLLCSCGPWLHELHGGTLQFMMLILCQSVRVF